MKKQISIPVRYIFAAAYVFLAIPIMIFFIGWLKWYWAILFSGIMGFGIFRMIKTEYWKKRDKLELPLKPFLIAVMIFGCWILLAGNCGVSVSNYDTPHRTAVLRDLIEYDWPVHYPQTGCDLIYYFTFWMVPALAGKLFGMTAAFAVLWFWQFIVVVISFLLILYIMKDIDPVTVWTVCLFFLLFSGLNNVGTVITEMTGMNLYGFQMGMNESYCDAFYNGESFNFYYRSNEDFICEPYNQIVLWMGVPLMLESRQIRNYAAIGLLLFPYSPWATIGIALLMIVDVVKCIKEKGFVFFIKECLSVQNLCVLASVFTVFAFFFTASTQIGGDGGPSFGILSLYKISSDMVAGFIIFVLCEYAVYYLFLFKKNKNDGLFKSLFPILFFIPFFWLGNIWGRDFCMNASLPALFVLMIYMIRFFLDEVWHKELNLKTMSFLICLVLAMSSPVMDWAVKAKVMLENRSAIVQDDRIYTFSDKLPEDQSNFVTAGADKSVFFRIFGKEYKE